jgi:hypothetical protein
MIMRMTIGLSDYCVWFDRLFIIHHDLMILTNNILSSDNIHSSVSELQLNNDDWWWIDEHIVFSLLYNGCYLTLLIDIASCHCGCKLIDYCHCVCECLFVLLDMIVWTCC